MIKANLGPPPTFRDVPSPLVPKCCILWENLKCPYTYTLNNKPCSYEQVFITIVNTPANLIRFCTVQKS